MAGPGGTLEAFAYDASDNLYHNWQTSNNWSSWSNWLMLTRSNIPSASGAVSSIKDYSGAMNLFYVDQNGNVETDVSNASDPGGWSGWSTIGAGSATFAGKLGAVVNKNNGVDIFVRDASGNIWWNTKPNGGAYTTWTKLSGSPLVAAGDPQATINTNYSNIDDVFVTGTDGNIWQDYESPSTGSWVGFATYFANGSAFAGDIGYTNISSNPSIYATDVNGNVWTVPNSTGVWQTLPTGVQMSADPLALANTNYSNIPDVFVRQSNIGTIDQSYYYSGSWSGWSVFPPPPQSAGGPYIIDLSYALNNANSPDIFVRDASGNVWHISESSGVWSNWTELPFGESFLGSPSLSALSNGNLANYEFGADGNLYETVQQSGSWTSTWSAVGLPF